MKSDIEIASEFCMQPISAVAARYGFGAEELEPYGKYKAKVSPKDGGKAGRLILVTAINPTPYGEGKTTVSIGLADGFTRLGISCMLALREPSLGPVFGVKGGACGGGYSQVVPMQDINLHFTGDLHAVTAANNLIAAVLDTHIMYGKSPRVCPEKVAFRRCIDLNDRALREVTIGLGGEKNGVPRAERFTITAASEVMAVLCLAKDMGDLKRRIANILVGYTEEDEPVYVRDIGCTDAACLLLAEAIKPNLVQTMGGTLAAVHGGPFANIAHGCNSVIATKLALSHSDVCVTEAGFGADLGAEKFFDVVCRENDIFPDAAVLVVTLKALKYGADPSDEGFARLEKGLANLVKHVENLTGVYGVPVAVAINRYDNDDDTELQFVRNYCQSRGADAEIVEVYQKGGAGSVELCRMLSKKIFSRNSHDRTPKFCYTIGNGVREKLLALTKRIYGGADVRLSTAAEQGLARIERMNLAHLPVIVAKTQYSLSDNPELLGRPEGFTLEVNELYPQTGAGFVVAVAGSMLLLPGLGKTSAALGITLDAESGEVRGLF